ncbi:type I restriction enzyme S subunit [Acinetobacter lwoffii]|uniref:Type I restriction enzyme S subunit n=1 Tax=Acinetobacter lwoffii TaxID=28090 RepID=A0AAW8LIU8_ACILW|nr:restriction endonuclease subunit S [Acinetobacter lwoffii]MDR6631007.1 type I restriction enzyme S subunit [Acinetobacter lwoffii]
MAKYQKYAEYKDSGTDWLGEIPTHWDVQPTKRFFRLIAEPAPENNDYELLSVYTEIGVKPRKELEQKGNKASTTDGYWLVKKGDIVVNKLLAWMGAVGYSEYDGVTSPAYDILRPTKKLNPKFYHYLFRTKIANMEFKRWSRGIMEMRLRLYFDELGRIAMPFPTFKEQNEIVNFLDHETAKIDSLITKQEKLIELLKEKRQSVISHAVTKGLNPDVPMKDSGVEWLGKVPEHWQLVPLKYLCTFSGGGTPTKDNLSYWTDGNIPWVSPKDMKTFWISETQDYITEKAVKESSTNIVEQNSLLMVVRSGILQRTIPIAINTVPVTMNQDMKALKFGKRVLVEYIANLIHGNTAQLLLEWSKEGATVESIEHEYLANSLIPLPSLKEQEEITQVIAKKMKVYAELTEKAKLQITLLQERRTALISSAVTGKIDVRYHASRPSGNDKKQTEGI